MCGKNVICINFSIHLFIMEELSPIVLFVYNRPDHTKRTLEALEKNMLARESTLYIFSDGAKNDMARDAVDKVRSIINGSWNFKSIHVVERDVNCGLANNVIDGVSRAISNHGKAIVLEDDVLLAEHALSYFNEALTLYENEEKIMHISGFIYELDRTNLSETFFTRYVASQAWATWGRAWNCFQEDIGAIIEQFDEKKVSDFTFDGTMNFWRQIQQQRDGKVDSWAIRWYASVFLKRGLALSPNQSLIENIGHDGSGIHSEISKMFDTAVRKEPITSFPADLEESIAGYRALKHYFRHRKGNIIKRAIRFVRNKWNK